MGASPTRTGAVTAFFSEENQLMLSPNRAPVRAKNLRVRNGSLSIVETRRQRFGFFDALARADRRVIR
jgi:hypothetical protein